MNFEWQVLGFWSFFPDKTFLWVSADLTLWPWPLCLTYALKILTMPIAYIFRIVCTSLIEWLFIVLRLAQKYFAYMAMSPLPVKGCKI
jgi:hypothetical protein